MDISKLSPDARAKQGIAYVPQGREIFPRLTVEENLQMGLATQARGARIPSRCDSRENAAVGGMKREDCLRHREINNFLARKFCRDLDVKEP